MSKMTLVWLRVKNNSMHILFSSWICLFVGLLPLWRITMQGHYQLRIIIKDWGAKGETKHAMYKYFKIGRPEELYTLQALGYSGTAGMIYM